MEQLLGREVDLREVEDKIIENFRQVFEFEKIEQQQAEAVQTALI